MHVKTYIGKRTQDILVQIKEELGPEAVILSNRSLRKNGVRYYEVTAGVERHLTLNDTAPTQGALGQGVSRAAAKAAYATASNNAVSNEAVDDGGSQTSDSSSSKTENIPKEAVSAAKSQTSDAKRVREMAANYVKQSQSSDEGNAGSQNPVGWAQWHKEWLLIKDHLFALMKPSIQMDRLSPRQRVALEYLQREGVSDVVVLELYRRLLSTPSDSVLECLSHIVPVQSWDSQNWAQRLHCFTGPFGVGKTTTALRMALQLRSKNQNCKVAFINADCMRGNGRLVLRHWAELSDFAYVEAQDELGMTKALVSQANADKIFIDLPSLGAGVNLQELYTRLGLRSDIAGPKATHCVLSPTYDGPQLMNFLQRYAPDGAGSLVWAKLDEAMSFGSIVNAAATCHLPVSALSYGAELRDSLSVASPSLLWRLIFKRQLPTVQAQA